MAMSVSPTVFTSVALKLGGFLGALAYLPRKLSKSSKCKIAEKMFTHPVFVGISRVIVHNPKQPHPYQPLRDWLADCVDDEKHSETEKRILKAVSEFENNRLTSIPYSYSDQREDLLRLEAALHECSIRLYINAIPPISHDTIENFLLQQANITDASAFINETAGRLALLQIAVSQVEIPSRPRATKRKSRIYELITDLIDIHDEIITHDDSDRRSHQLREFINLVCEVLHIRHPEDVDRLIRRAQERRNPPAAEGGDSAGRN